ncbi:MAG: xanthine dehydrogenase molybdopterin binding subunit [Pseudomonadota bacterium]
MPDSGAAPPPAPGIKGDVREARAHDSAVQQVTGKARYVDDIPKPPGLLSLYIAMSDRAHARITSLDLEAVRRAPGVALVLSSDDVPGTNDIGPVVADEPLFAEGEVLFHGQPIFAVAAESEEAARRAAAFASVEYEDLPAHLTVEDAMAAGMDLEPEQVMARGDATSALKNSPRRLTGTLTIGGQDHLYLEGQVALALPGEDNDVHVFSSTQNPTEVQHLTARLLGIPDAAVTVEVRRMGGAFGGKETQSTIMAAASALAAMRTGRPVECVLDRDDDMRMTGKRHDFIAQYEVGYGEDGRLTATHFALASRCGHATDLSFAINDRAMFHADNCYHYPAVRIASRRLRTHTVSNTAFRGFGGPQGMLAAERMIDEVAFELDRDPVDVRLANLYADGNRSLTPYHQTVDDCVAGALITELMDIARYRERRDEIDAYNAASPVIKKGIALTPVKFGISFTTKHLNQAGALIHVYTDGSVHLNHGGTEMGQGLMVKVAQVVAHEFQIDIDRIKVSSTRTDKVPNTSATAASSGSDLNGMAARNAAQTIKERLVAFAAESYGVSSEAILFEGNHVLIGAERLTFAELVKKAYLGRVSLSASGYYRTPTIDYDRAKHRGHPFYYFAYGAAVSEVAIDTLTGETRVLQTDILHDVGQSLNPAIDLGQVEGGFVQGMGWLTSEELVYDDNGVLRTHAPSTYKIPTAGDRPLRFNAELWASGRNKVQTIHRSKAVGEPPFMLAISVFSAITHAVTAAAGGKVFPKLDAPATPERVLMAIEDAKARAAGVDGVNA